MNKQSGNGEPRKEGLDEPTAAFCVAASQVAGPLWRGEELRTRQMILGTAAGLIRGLLHSMQYPRDVQLIEDLVNLNFSLTSHLDSIVWNGGPDDLALQKLRELAEQCGTWATLVRPADPKFTESKIRKLKVGSKAVLPSLPIKARRAPSLATEANRLALRLVQGLTNSAESVLKIGHKGVLRKKTHDEVRRDLLVFGLAEQKHAEYVEILELVERYPFSPKNLTQWGGILADYVLFQRPRRFTELKSLLRDEDLWDEESPDSHKRSKLQQFFRRALEHLAANQGRR